MKALSKLALHNMTPYMVGDSAGRVGVRLTSLELFDCPVFDSTLGQIALLCERLQVLRIRTKSEIHLTSLGLELLSNSPCAQCLKELCVQGGAPFLSFEMTSIFFPRIEVLQIAQCTSLVVLPALANTSTLSSVDFSLCGNIRKFPFFDSVYPCLLSINLCGCALVNDAMLQTMASSCPHIDHLFISNCVRVTDFGIGQFVSKIRKGLLSFSCANCVNVGDVGLSKICTQRLQFLDCQHCHRVSNRLLFSLAKHCCNLTHLYLKGMSAIQDEGIECLARHCLKLEECSFASCSQLTDAALHALATFSSRLSALDLFCVEKITDEGLLHVVRSCVRLQSLIVSWCFQLTPDVLSRLERSKRFRKRFHFEGLATHTAAKGNHEKKPPHSPKRVRSPKRQRQKKTLVPGIALQVPVNLEERQQHHFQSSISPEQHRRIYGEDASDSRREMAFLRLDDSTII